MLCFGQADTKPYTILNTDIGPKKGITVYCRRARSRCNNWFEVKVFKSYCQPSEKSQ